MNEQDFSKRMVIVARKDIDPWQIVNTVAHISAYMGNQLKERFGTGEYFSSKDGVHYPNNTQYPIIIKRAGSDEQLKNFMHKVRESEVLYHIYIKEMIETTSDAEIQDWLDKKTDVEVEYLGVGIFGDHDTVNTLSKKFGLWK